MDIGAGKGYPSAALSNFAPHEFEFRGVKCASMEGLLQSFKFKSPEMQVEICKMVGIKAKHRGKDKKWYREQTLYWQGSPIKRNSQEYQDMLNEAYDALAKNGPFRSALLATNNAVLTHSLGRSKINETVLTQSEFCGRLMRLRERIKKDEI
jgi:predicted NAD-dependent protein-ADP-ribosyltransferase YbiA (DUF1768 family)